MKEKRYRVAWRAVKTEGVVVGVHEHGLVAGKLTVDIYNDTWAGKYDHWLENEQGERVYPEASDDN